MIVRSALLGLGVGAPTSVVASVLADQGGVNAVIYGVPAAAVVGFLSMVYKLLWNALDEERKGRDADRVAHSAELAVMNKEAIERAERVATLLAEVNRLLPTLLEALKKARAPVRKAGAR